MGIDIGVDGVDDLIVVQAHEAVEKSVSGQGCINQKGKWSTCGGGGGILPSWASCPSSSINDASAVCVFFASDSRARDPTYYRTFREQNAQPDEGQS